MLFSSTKAIFTHQPQERCAGRPRDKMPSGSNSDGGGWDNVGAKRSQVTGGKIRVVEAWGLQRNVYCLTAWFWRPPVGRAVDWDTVTTLTGLYTLGHTGHGSLHTWLRTTRVSTQLTTNETGLYTLGHTGHGSLHTWPFRTLVFTHLAIQGTDLYILGHTGHGSLHTCPYRTRVFTHLPIQGTDLYILAHNENWCLYTWPYRVPISTHLAIQDKGLYTLGHSGHWS